MLVKGRIDAVIAIELSAQQIILKNGYQEQIESLESPLAVNPNNDIVSIVPPLML